MKLFLHQFGIWLGIGLLLPLLVMFTLSGNSASDYSLIAIIGWSVLFITTIISITRIKILHKKVSFGKAFLSGLLFHLIFSLLLTAYFYNTFQPAEGSFYSLIESEVFLQEMTLELFLGTFFVGLGVLLYILLFAGVWYTLVKAKQPGWAIFIPIYNVIVILQIAKKPTWWFFMFLIPIANIVFAIKMLNGVSKNFGKDEGFTLGLFFLPMIFWSVLGYGDAQYLENATDPLENPTIS